MPRASKQLVHEHRQYHDLFVTTRTSIQDPSIQPPGIQSNTFYILKQGEHEGEEGFWVEDAEGLEGFMSTNDEETFWVLEENDAFIARKVSARNFKFKKRKRTRKNNKQKGKSPFKPFRKGSSGGKIWPMSIRIPTTRHIGEKAKERRERKENQNSNTPMMETKVIHPMTMAKEKADKKKENPKRSQPSQRRRRSSPPSSRLHHPQSLPMPVGQIKIGIHLGVNKAGAHPMRHPAQDKRQWHSMVRMSIMRKRPSTRS